MPDTTRLDAALSGCVICVRAVLPADVHEFFLEELLVASEAFQDLDLAAAADDDSFGADPSAEAPASSPHLAEVQARFAGEPLVGSGLCGAEGLMGRCLTFKLQLDRTATQSEYQPWCR